MKPWRGVTHIDYQTGSKGGRVWWLTLDCGHHAARKIPRFYLPFAIGNMDRALKRRTAPQRVRCALCPAL